MSAFSSLSAGLRQAPRALARRRGFSLLVIAILGLGIGAASAVFALVAALLRPLPFPDSDRLVMVWESQREKGREKLHVSPPNLRDWIAQAQSFSGLSAITEDSYTVSGGAGAERVPGASVSLNFFSTLGVELGQGRGFVHGDDKGKQAYVVVLSHAYWQSRFGGSPDVVGRSIRIDGLPRTVVGIVPEGREYPRYTKLWLPMVFCDCDEARDKHYLGVLGRIKPDATLPRAQREMDTIAARLSAQYPATNAGWSARVVPLVDELIGGVRPTLRILAGAVALLVLIACANVASLLLARGLLRRPELAVRQALGASRSQVSLLLFFESLAFAVLGSLVGVALAWSLLRLSLPFLPADLVSFAPIGLDRGVLAFALGLGVLTSLAFGLVPALHASRSDLAETLKPGARGSVGGRPLRRRNVVVGGAFAL
ncbi:MAG TPA: ABC transporter permease, partial [Thermoanaerobaculia bacterium]